MAKLTYLYSASNEIGNGTCRSSTLSSSGCGISLGTTTPETSLPPVMSPIRFGSSEQTPSAHANSRIGSIGCELARRHRKVNAPEEPGERERYRFACLLR